MAADRDRVGQVLVNLISNALKYSPAGGLVAIGVAQRGDFVKVFVRDQGLGISEEDLGQMFTKFFRVDSAMTREIGGTGLGLSICKTIIELLGGEIGVESVLGEGSTFWFTLPVAPDRDGAHPAARGAGRTGHRHDPRGRPRCRRSPTSSTRTWGGTATTSSRPTPPTRRSSRRCATSREAITLDVILDEGDGFDLLQRLKDSPETADIPVVVLSIVCDEGRSCRMGAANYLEKPIDQSRLLAMIDDIVGSISSPVALVVDDDRDIVKLLSETLQAQGVRGRRRLRRRRGDRSRSKQRVPDIIVTDLKMPKMDGYELIQRVKTTPRLGRHPHRRHDRAPHRSREDPASSTWRRTCSTSRSRSKGIAREVDGRPCRQEHGGAPVKRVLAVDDEPHILKLIAFSLRAHGFEVLEASDGLSAISVAEAEHPDLILLDVMMPALDGYEACRRIKADPATADIPIFMLTAKARPPSSRPGWMPERSTTSASRSRRRTSSPPSRRSSPSRPTPKEGAPNMSAKILVVDDEPSIVKLVTTTLESRGYTVFPAYDGRECLTEAKIHKPDLILLDIMMPHMDGREARKKLLADPATAGHPGHPPLGGRRLRAAAQGDLGGRHRLHHEAVHAERPRGSASPTCSTRRSASSWPPSARARKASCARWSTSCTGRPRTDRAYAQLPSRLSEHRPPERC